MLRKEFACSAMRIVFISGSRALWRQREGWERLHIGRVDEALIHFSLSTSSPVIDYGFMQKPL